MRIFFVKLAAVIIAAGLVLTGCPNSTSSDDVPVIRVRLSAPELKMGPNTPTTLVATVEPSNATNKGLLWTSSDETVATVSDAGVVTSKAIDGTTVIRVVTKDGGKEAFCTVTVDLKIQEGTVAVSGVQLSETTKTLDITKTFTLTATIVPKEADDGKKTVTWASSDETVATVKDGLVTAVAIGSARITATVEGKSATCTVTVTDPAATVQSLLETGISNLKGGYFDSALTSFEAAFVKDVKGSETYTESVVYSSLAKLASLVKDQSFRNLLSNHTGVTNYPESIDELLKGDWMEHYTDEEFLRYYDDNADHWVSWRDAKEDAWFFENYKVTPKSGYYRYKYVLLSTERKTGKASSYYDENTGRSVYWYDYNPNTDNETGTAGYYYWNDGLYVLVSSTPKIIDLNSYDDEETGKHVTWYATENPPGYYYSDGTYILVTETPKYNPDAQLMPGLPVPEWFKDTNAYKDSLSMPHGFKTPGTWELLLMANLLDKNSSGLNSALDDVLSSVFGTVFEDAVARANLLDYTTSFKVDEDTLDLLGVRDLFEGDVNIGKAELDLLFSAMRVLKASLQWVSAYDWDTDLSFLKTEWKGLDGSIDKLSPANLPFRNNFMKDRNNGRMADSKASYSTAIETAIAAYESMITTNHLPQGVVDELKKYDWIKDGLSKLKTAINDGSTFYLKVGSGATYSNDSTNALFGVNLGKFFTPGQFAIDKLITADGNAPKFFGMKDGQNTAIAAKDQIKGFEMIGFEFKTTSLKEVFVYGFDYYLSDDNGICIPLFPSKIAEQLYGLYHP
ncbi:MAG: Ig-like domain-containing protein [Treponema sp.]|jgi:hypothetical protein|nr:Ig-like domain-containing protein [Treponema sp.]